MRVPCCPTAVAKTLLSLTGCWNPGRPGHLWSQYLCITRPLWTEKQFRGFDPASLPDHVTP